MSTLAWDVAMVGLSTGACVLVLLGAHLGVQVERLLRHRKARP